jgi:uncharacterized membrane protein YebE (DUF533 family)
MRKTAPERLSPPEALIYAMVTVSAADRTISAGEIARIGAIVRELPSFVSYSDDWLSGAAQDCGSLLTKPNGVEKVLILMKASLPPSLRETAYVLCAEVAVSDHTVHADEKRFLAMLGSALELDDLVCAALERAARARHRKG